MRGKQADKEIKSTNRMIGGRKFSKIRKKNEQAEDELSLERLYNG